MRSLVDGLRGACSLSLYLVNTLIVCVPLFTVALAKLLLPFRPVQAGCRKLLTAIATCWIGANRLIQRLLTDILWDVDGVDHLDPNGWYVVVANHQSWVDIVVLQSIFFRRIPFLKFFLKRELIWFPLLGQAWWALDFPFMKRYSRAFLKKHPHLIGQDLEITRQACEKFRGMPVSIMNFVEGTRFTREKHARQQSPYTHLLRTKAGGIAFVLAAMGDRLQQIVDVTIAYPQGAATFWDFACGRVTEIKVHVRTLPVSRQLMGDYLRDAQFKREFQDWLNGLWRQKDLRLAAMLAGKVKS